MNKKTIAILICVAAAAAVLICAGQRRKIIEIEEVVEDAEEVGARYDTIPLRKRIARMFVIGIDSTALKVNDPVIGKIEELGVGGVILFGYNIPKGDEKGTSREKLTRLCSDLQGLADYGLMIGTDQEGGKVMRLRERDGYEEMPSHKYLGRLNMEDTTRFYAGRTAGMLKSIGINANFAPCVDVNVNASCPAIGKADRSFSPEPETVGIHAGIFIDEHRKHGVATAIKHFPGHGSSVADSHKGLTDVSNTWQEKELVPFRRLIRSGRCDMIMIGHIYNSRIDPEYPASLSEATVKDLLRQELGWDGIVISDDLGMKAINDNYPLEDSLPLSINAGVDMVMLIANGSAERLEMAIDIITTAVYEGLITEERINESYARIDKMFGK